MAGRPRTPSNVLKLRGADKKNPARMKERQNEPENTHPIGDPPSFLTKTEQAAWHELLDNSIDGVLGKADRVLLEMAARKLVKLRGLKRVKNAKGKMVVDKAGPQDETIFTRYLSQMGMSPVDRSKISIPKGPEKNEFDEF